MFGFYLLAADEELEDLEDLEESGDLPTSTALTSWSNKWFYWSLVGTKVKGMRYVGDEAVCAPGNPYQDPSDPNFRNPHPVPTSWHTCGFYAYHDLARLSGVTLPGGATVLEDAMNHPLQYMKSVWSWSQTGKRRSFSAPPVVVGLVQGHGRGVIHDTTYRVQKMRIAALCSDGLHTGELIKSHAQLLGIPALSLEEMKEYSEYAGACLKPKGTTYDTRGGIS